MKVNFSPLLQQMGIEVFRGTTGRKDAIKASKANKFIGLGAHNSSTERYRIAAGPLAWTHSYTSTDVVFVSINGNRGGAIRVSDDRYIAELGLAYEAGAAIVADRPGRGFGQRDSSHNRLGEGALASYLEELGYTERNYDGMWVK